MRNGRARWRACARPGPQIDSGDGALGVGSGNRVEACGLCREYYLPWRRGAPYIRLRSYVRRRVSSRYARWRAVLHRIAPKSGLQLE